METLTEEEIKKIEDEVIEACDRIWNLRSNPNVDFDVTKVQNEALQKAEKINFTFGVARCILNNGMGLFILKNDFTNAIKEIDRAIQLFSEIHNEKWVCNSLLTKAIICNSKGMPETALYDGLKGISYYEKNTNDPELPMAFYLIGTIYKDLKIYDKAIAYFKEGIDKEKEFSSWSGRLFTSLSNIYMEQGNYDEALELSYKSLDILIHNNNHIGESRALNDIGHIHKRKGNLQEALKNFLQALEIRKKNDIKYFLLGSLLDVAAVYKELGDYSSCEKYLLEAEHYGKETAHDKRLIEVYQSLANLYREQNRLEETIEVYEKLNNINITTLEKEREEKLNQSQSKLLKEKEEEIERLRNVELKRAYLEIEQKNRDIQDSINYAKRIQQALLTSEKSLQEFLSKYFVFFQPKDIVSGDFYWAAATNNEDFGPKCVFLCVADSTGHGVPGAFMSLLNITYLNEAVNEKNITEPNEVLNFVRQRLIENLNKENQKDGFDGIIVKINYTTKEISYAAANNAPVLVSNNIFTELPFDKMPVGYSDKDLSFTNHTINYKPGDFLYLYTDGFADQFGGPKGKKYMYKKLNEKLVEFSRLDISVQKEKLMVEFNTWKGELEQTDDVCVFGLSL